nr:2Fe-2S iron-sulfur cluster-binding protein [Streptomonospora mangrovi]
MNGHAVAADDVWPGESLLFVLRERLGLPGSKNACEQGECGSCTVYLDDVTVCACLVAAGQAAGRRVRTVEGLAAQPARAGAGAAGADGGVGEAGGIGADGRAGGAAVAAGPGSALGARGDTAAGGAAGADTGQRDPDAERLSPVQRAFLEEGAVQCGFCTPGLLVQAHDLVARTVGAGGPVPGDAHIREALAGNLCRCTGYQAIVAAVRRAAEREHARLAGQERP